MSDENNLSGSMPAPPLSSEEGAIEVLRVWVAPSQEQQANIRLTDADEGVWGLLLAGVVRDIANAYASQGRDPQEVFKRIFETFEAEFMPVQEVEDDGAAGTH